MEFRLIFLKLLIEWWILCLLADFRTMVQYNQNVYIYNQNLCSLRRCSSSNLFPILSNFIMICYKIPKKVVSSIDFEQSKFWWGKKGDNFGRFISGKKICEPKWNGDAGIRSLFNMSIALLAKSAWRILTDTDSLLSHVFRPKFGNKFNWEDCTANGSSPSLNSVIKTGLEQLKNKVVWKIGDGSRIRSLGAWFARSYPKS